MALSPINEVAQFLYESMLRRMMLPSDTRTEYLRRFAIGWCDRTIRLEIVQNEGEMRENLQPLPQAPSRQDDLLWWVDAWQYYRDSSTHLLPRPRLTFGRQRDRILLIWGSVVFQANPHTGRCYLLTGLPALESEHPARWLAEGTQLTIEYLTNWCETHSNDARTAGHHYVLRAPGPYYSGLYLKNSKPAEGWESVVISKSLYAALKNAGVAAV